jgi:integrase
MDLWRVVRLDWALCSYGRTGAGVRPGTRRCASTAARSSVHWVPSAQPARARVDQGTGRGGPAPVVRELEAAPPPPVEERTLAQVGESYLRELGTRGRRRPTLGDYESYLRVHLVPFFDGTPLRKIGRAEVEAFMAAKLQAGLAPKSVRNYLGLLHSLFEYAERRDWAPGNPCRLVDRPGEEEADSDIRFLSDEELDALLRAVPETGVGRLDRVLYLTAATTGLRQAELLGLRWRDVDWPAARVRVRQSFVRGEFGKPKSKRSSRSVPLADRVAGKLDRYFQGSVFQADDDLVFGNPRTGRPLARRAARKRFQENLERAGVASALPRLAPYLRLPHGRRRGAAAHTPSVDGPPRLQDHADLCRLPAGRRRSGTRGEGLRRTAKVRNARTGVGPKRRPAV